MMHLLRTPEGVAGGRTMNGTLTDVPGLEVGHYTDLTGGTGCTVVLSRDGAVGGVDVRGAAPGTRETDLLRPDNSVERVHGILLSGGSAYGLAAADGVMRYLEEQGCGHRVGPFIVPIVPAAIIFDLGLGSSDVRPGPDEGYAAAAGARRVSNSLHFITFRFCCRRFIVPAEAVVRIGRVERKISLAVESVSFFCVRASDGRNRSHIAKAASLPLDTHGGFPPFLWLQSFYTVFPAQ